MNNKKILLACTLIISSFYSAYPGKEKYYDFPEFLLNPNLYNKCRVVSGITPKEKDGKLIETVLNHKIHESCRKQMVIALLRAGANPNLVITTHYDRDLYSILKPDPKFRGTLLHIAINRGETGIANALIISGAKINEQDSDGNTPLHLAIGASRFSSYVGKPDPKHVVYDGKSIYNKLNKTTSLLILSGADLNIKNNKEETPAEIRRKIFANLIEKIDR